MPALENGIRGRETNSLPIIGITMGDAAGIGPEIILKSIADAEVAAACRPLVIGDAALLRRTAEFLGLPFGFPVSSDLKRNPASFPAVLDLGNLPPDLEIGVLSADAGRAAAEYIKAAVGLWRDGRLAAIATAPLNKKSLSRGGFDFPGHTEFLAGLTDTREFAMSFFAGNLRVVLLSTHLSLLDAIARVKREPLVRLICFAAEKFSGILRRPVRIAVAGLNPHASEGGLFGTEEAREIAPAIAECVGKYGIDVSGPYSPDTIFLRGYRGEFDAVIACYHDQATIAVKALSFGAAVNVTLGLPLIRTSVDHGTAFDIAGKGEADASSMKAAILLAAQLGRDTVPNERSADQADLAASGRE